MRIPAWPAARLTLQPRDDAHGRTSFVRAAIDESLWPQSHKAMFGASALSNRHCVTLEAIADIVMRHTGEPPQQYSRTNTDNVRDTGRILAEWLREMARTSAQTRISLKQLSYFFASGSQRAYAIATVLNHIAHRPIKRMSDVGTGVGMIPWLLRTDFPEISHFELFEPEPKFHPALDLLWTQRDPAHSYTLTRARAEQADFGTGNDLIIFCQCSYLVAREERPAVLKRAWGSLNPGGVLLVNEVMKNASVFGTSHPDLIDRNEMMAIMPGNHRIFLKQSGWKKAEDIRRVPAWISGSRSMLVSVRDA
ncbi:MAG TPA: hypothetical protein VK779_11705 [Rhizomicrobium sp.]|jgi:hypothetical protein|nr:hypothetical protein [Rhizomicrobium sp.]